MQTTLHTILYIAKVVRAMVDKYKKKNIYGNYILLIKIHLIARLY